MPFFSFAPLRPYGCRHRPVININGFKEEGHRLRNVSFTNIALPDGATVVVNDAERIAFTNVKSTAGATPQYVVNNSANVSH